MNKTNSIAVITPSYIDSWKRFYFAYRAWISLKNNINNEAKAWVVNDIPKFVFPLGFNQLIINWAVKKLYSGDKTILLNRKNTTGSKRALLDGVMAAMNKGNKYIFIHLDDNVYIPIIKNLIVMAEIALEHDPRLKFVRFSGRPIISHLCDEKRGNQTFLKYNKVKDKISFEKIVFSPTRYPNFTLWTHPLESKSITNYWAVSMWSTLYRIDYLEKLLNHDLVKRLKYLGQVEQAYQDPVIWNKFITENPGKLGYINMQFGGLEMHRNKNWRKLIKLPNEAVR